ncbi:MAG: hypothetical protein IJR06_07545 [Paludibacteraceae bacterium]|nr:hypothetical protein [Paludibacteraceae bacterium]
MIEQKQIRILARKFSKTKVIAVAILRATWFWLFVALMMFFKFDWRISVFTPIGFLFINTLIVLYKYFIKGQFYTYEIVFKEMYMKIIYVDFNNLKKVKEIDYQNVHFSFYNKFRIDYLNFKSPITLSIYNENVLVEDIRNGEYGWTIKQLEQLYDEIAVRTLPFSKDMKKEIPVKIKGTSKPRKQFPDTCPYVGS